MADRAVCPFCARRIEVTKNDTLKTHRIQGEVCAGSGALAYGHYRETKQ